MESKSIYSAQVQQYKDSVKEKAEELILKGFPKKIDELNELLQTSQFRKQDLNDVHQKLNIPVPDPIDLSKDMDIELSSRKCRCDIGGTRVMVLPGGMVPCNKQLCELVHVVKPHIRQLIEDTNLLKMWITFMIPKIEDGNNFGVSIQEDTLAEIQSVESEAASFYDQISRYFLSRAKMVSKVAKYPHVEDYRRAMKELDEKEYLSLWLVMSEVRNRYCTIYDIVIKNLEKIKKPRNSNADSLY
ncbi:proteasome activator complex subunit 3 isoform X1 [Anabrus simplex]|uniref:proteasome activator complex subunit 3 isoform X1 n=1 Tax=Anabrus simplex TaxID=316456 RepID=UPI0034DD0197